MSSTIFVEVKFSSLTRFKPLLVRPERCLNDDKSKQIEIQNLFDFSTQIDKEYSAHASRTVYRKRKKVKKG